MADILNSYTPDQTRYWQNYQGGENPSTASLSNNPPYPAPVGQMWEWSVGNWKLIPISGAAKPIGDVAQPSPQSIAKATPRPTIQPVQQPTTIQPNKQPSGVMEKINTPFTMFGEAISSPFTATQTSRTTVAQREANQFKLWKAIEEGASGEEVASLRNKLFQQLPQQQETIQKEISGQYENLPWYAQMGAEMMMPIPPIFKFGKAAKGAKEAAEAAAKAKNVVPEVARAVEQVVPRVETVIPKAGFAGNIRLSKFPEAVQPELKKWAEDAANVTERTRGVRSHEVTLEAAQSIADKTGGDPAKLAKNLGQAYNAEEIKAIDGMLVQAQAELNAARLAAKTLDTTANIARVAQSQNKLSYWVALSASARAEAGRALESLKIFNNAIKTNDAKLMDAVIKRAGGRGKITQMMEAMDGLDWNNPTAINNFIRSMNKPTLKDYLFELYVNSILSGPKTHMVNTLSNGLNALISPTETFGSSTIEQVLARLQGRKPTMYMGEAFYESGAALTGFKDGVKSALHTMGTGVRPSVMSKYEFRPSAFSGKFGRAVNLPITALEAADELFFNVNYRMALNKLVYRAARTRGLSGKALLGDMADMIANPTDDIIKEASRIADYRLFRQPAGGFTQGLMNLREKTPGGVAKYFVPFLRTPVNLVKFGLERSPAGFANPTLWRNLIEKSPEAANQLARAIGGSAVTTALFFYVKDGNITGAAPTSAGARNRFYEEGKQPYSIKIGNTWVAYQRLEPFNQPISQLAALVDAVNNKESDGSIRDKFAIVAKDIGTNFVSQTYMSGISDIIDAISDPERYGATWLERTLASLIPYSSASRTIAQMLDRTVRQPSGFLQQAEVNLPVLSENVPAKLTSLGEETQRVSPPWSPINISPEVQSELNTEMSKAELNIGLAADKIGSIQLNEQEGRDYQAFVGQQIKLSLTQLITTQAYQDLSPAEKQKALQGAVGKTRDDAKDMFIMTSGVTIPHPRDSETIRMDRLELGKVATYLKDTNDITNDTARQLLGRVLRSIDPGLDVSLRLNGYTTTLRTDEAQSLYRQRINGEIVTYDLPYSPKYLAETKALIVGYYGIEDKIWSQFPPEARKDNDRIVKLGDLEAKNELIDSPHRGDIIVARQLINREKSLMKRINPELVDLLKF